MAWTDALLGTFFTWGVTALGAALVFVIPENQAPETERKMLDVSYGFAGGVMLAASFWSLLAPALEMAESDLGFSEELAWIPAAIGFLLGALFVWIGDQMTSDDQLAVFGSMFNKPGMSHAKSDDDGTDSSFDGIESGDADVGTGSTVRRRPGGGGAGSSGAPVIRSPNEDRESERQRQRLSRMKIRRVLLLVMAITVHNFPEGMAVGFGFGAVPDQEQGVRAHRRMFEKAWNLAIGIGIQNFPEGFAVSVPLYREGMSKRNAFFAGQASGMVEPIAGLLGYFLVSFVRALLPYALSFAAGAMIFVVCDDLLAEVHRDQSSSHGTSLASWGVMAGFTIMMILDVSLG